MNRTCVRSPDRFQIMNMASASSSRVVFATRSDRVTNVYAPALEKVVNRDRRESGRTWRSSQDKPVTEGSRTGASEIILRPLITDMAPSPFDRGVPDWRRTPPP